MGIEDDYSRANRLTADDEAKCAEAFAEFDKDRSGFIDADELRIVLEMMGQCATEDEIFRMISDADAQNTGQVSYEQFRRVVLEQKKKQGFSNEEDTLDAFVAVGGEPNGEGSVNANLLIKIIRDEFEMTIDIEKLIREVDEDDSGKIEYDEFKNLLSSAAE